MTTVLVGLDGSRAARLAFHAAVEQAQWRDATVTAFYSVFVPALLGKSLVPKGELTAYGDHVLDIELGALAEDFGGTIPIEVGRRVHMGHVGEGLLEAANDEDLGVELVVLGARGLGGFSSLLLGSVTTYAVHHLTVPLLIVPADLDDVPADEITVL